MGTVAYVMQCFPALRTTFIRRDIAALRRHGIPLSLVSIRPVDTRDIAAEAQAVDFQQETLYLPARPFDRESVYANVAELLRRPGTMLRCWGWALGDAGGRGLTRRVRLWLQIWRGPVLARRLRTTGTCQHVHAQFADGAATTGLVAAKLLGVGFSFTSHTSYDSPILAKKLKNARFIASISEYDRRTLLERSGADFPTRIQVIRCGIPLEDFPIPELRDVHQPLRILSVGALIEKKGHETLIRACGVLRDRGASFVCRIVGAGPMQGQLMAAISDLRLDALVTLAGPLPQAAVRAELARADVFVLASCTTADGDTDGIPVSLMEAMAVGVGVVSTSVAGIPELIEHGVSGFLVPQRDPATLADNIAACGGGNGARLTRLRTARHKIEREFNQDVESHKLAALLTEACAAGADPDSRKG